MITVLSRFIGYCCHVSCVSNLVTHTRLVQHRQHGPLFIILPGHTVGQNSKSASICLPPTCCQPRRHVMLRHANPLPGSTPCTTQHPTHTPPHKVANVLRCESSTRPVHNISLLAKPGGFASGGKAPTAHLHMFTASSAQHPQPAIPATAMARLKCSTPNQPAAALCAAWMDRPSPRPTFAQIS